MDNRKTMGHLLRGAPLAAILTMAPVASAQGADMAPDAASQPQPAPGGQAQPSPDAQPPGQTQPQPYPQQQQPYPPQQQPYPAQPQYPGAQQPYPTQPQPYPAQPQPYPAQPQAPSQQAYPPAQQEAAPPTPAETSISDNGWSTTGSHLVVGVERTFGIYRWSRTFDGSGASSGIKYSESGTQVNLLTGYAGVGDGSVNPAALPRIAIDGVVGSGVTLGGFLGVVTTSGSGEFSVPGNPTQDYDLNGTQLFQIGARGGYLLAINDMVSFWPRAGFAYFSAKSEVSQVTDNQGNQVPVDFENSNSGLLMVVDPALVVTPVDHVGLLVYPTVDIGLSGGWENRDNTLNQSVDGDFNMFNFGLSAGLSVFL